MEDVISNHVRLHSESYIFFKTLFKKVYIHLEQEQYLLMTYSGCGRITIPLEASATSSRTKELTSNPQMSVQTANKPLPYQFNIDCHQIKALRLVVRALWFTWKLTDLEGVE